MNEQKRITQWVICALKGAGITVLSGTLILLIFAWLIASGRIPEDLMEVSVLTALILASFFGGRAAVRCQGGTAGVTALVSGAVVLLGITIASAAENGLLFFTGRYMKLLVAIFAGSLAGGMLATRRRTPNRRRKNGR